MSCGVGKTFIAELSYKTSWNGVPVEVASKFMAACGVDPDKPWEVKRFLRRAKKYHIVNAHPRKKEMFLRILKGDPRSMKAGSGNGAV